MKMIRMEEDVHTEVKIRSAKTKISMQIIVNNILRKEFGLEYVSTE